jgi:site-specific DNA recombinase
LSANPTSWRAIVYARYSSDNQRDASVEDQVRICKERVAREGWTLAGVLVDRAFSGASVLRPGYQALLQAVRAGECDLIVAEALDRLSRDQADIAWLFRLLRFAGVRILTLAEGDISELHIGLKGTMNALFLKDLAQKTHRGLRGRVELGRSAGGNAYGYRVLRRVDADGSSSTGERQIDAREAEVVQRIYRAYAAGVSPKRIALTLNAEGIAGPRGGAWNASTINGNRLRGTGILNNELYIGRLVWNRLVYVKDPETGRRRSRARDTTERISVDVPDLRIVPDELWEMVRSRQAQLEHRREGDGGQPRPFWSKQRPRYVFSGLMRCGMCGAGFSKISANLFGCSGARNKGPTVCTNRLTLRRNALEETVFGRLRGRLMDPLLFQAFVETFTAEWNRLQGAAAADRHMRETELGHTRQQIERLVDAIVSGTPSVAVRDRLAALEQRRISLETEMASAIAPAPRLHPNLAEMYRRKVAELTQVLDTEGAAEARELVLSLVETITLVPEDGQLRIEVRGELAAILQLADQASAGKQPTDGRALAEQIKMVAGARNRRSHHSTVPI